MAGAKGQERPLWLSPGESVRDLDIAPEMVLVPPGTFWMGSKDDEGGADERPRHEVTISYPLLAGKHPVTFEEWDAFEREGGIADELEVTSGLLFKKTETTWKKYTPPDAGWGRGQRPAINVSWNDAAAYAAWLSKATGKSYGLLSEAEWEYCCRAGTETRYNFGAGPDLLGEYAWFASNSNGMTQPVGRKEANGFGLHDMHGNIWEWVEDPWHGDYEGAPPDGSVWTAGGDTSHRVLRGGSWATDAEDLRSAFRFWTKPILRSRIIGFRLARTLTLP